MVISVGRDGAIGWFGHSGNAHVRTGNGENRAQERVRTNAYHFGNFALGRMPTNR